MSPEEINNLRDALGWTVREMARYLNVSKASISGWENGRCRPTGERIALMVQLRKRVSTMDAAERRRLTQQLEDIQTRKENELMDWKANWRVMRLLFGGVR